ncbi:MAG: N-acetylmuramoyl-L-alanine amidase, partial [Selenomonas sp.]|nr:N-acetylmuramoyl-L-alanine amidase [Selenomonas sp.]
MSAVLPASAMRRVTCRELRLLGAAYRLPLAYAAARCARETKLYLHWTAGHYGQFFADYHVQIDADGAIYVIGDGALDA